MEKKFPELLKELQSGKYAPVYFLHGEEPYFIDQISDFIEQNALQEFEKGFNQMILYGKDTDMGTILGNARRYPMMAERQVVIVKEAQELEDFRKEQGAKLLDSYLQNQVPSTVLVFAYKHGSPDKRKAFYKALVKEAVVMESKKLYENQVPDFIAQYVASKGRKISPDATRTLTELIGANLDRIVGEVNKTLINIKEGETISNEVVLQYVGLSKEFNVFELIKALGKRDAQMAFRIVIFFAANPKNNPLIPMMANLYNFWSKVLVMHRLGGKSPKDQAAILGVNPYFLGDYQIAVQNYPLWKVIKNMEFLLEADLKSKGVGASNMSEGEILKELVYKLMY
jgi:DNA polymerase-3 subunit delta